MNNRYKIRLSKEPIFWTTNSVNHPSEKLWQNTYLPTFSDVDGCPINWLDIFSISTVLDDSDYTMLELTDTVKNQVYYFLSKSITKKLANGFEMIFTIDIYLTFGMKFYKWLSDNKLPIQVKRFLSQTLLIEWYKQQKYTQKDNLLDYKNGTAKFYESSNFMCQNMGLIQLGSDGYHIYDNSSTGLRTDNLTQYLKLTGTNIDKSGAWFDNNNLDGAIFRVYETDDGNYFCFLIGQYNSNNYTTIKSNNTNSGDLYIVNGDFKNFVQIGPSNTNIESNIKYCVDVSAVKKVDSLAYFNNKLVGEFIIPNWKLITLWYTFIVFNGTISAESGNLGYVTNGFFNFFQDIVLQIYGGSTGFAVSNQSGENSLKNVMFLLGTIIQRDKFKPFAYRYIAINANANNIYDLINYSYKIQIQINNNNYVSDDSIYTDDNRDSELVNNLKYNLVYNLDTSKIIDESTNTIYLNYYLISNTKFLNNQQVPLSPTFNYNYAVNGFLTFDGMKFNVVSNIQNSSTIINESYGTINESMSSYDNYIAAVKPQLNTNLQVAKSQMDLQIQQNNANNVLNTIGNIFTFGLAGLSGSASSAGNSALGAISSNVNTSFNNQQLQLNYQNLQKQQDAQIASAKNSSNAINISATNTQDDCFSKWVIVDEIGQNSTTAPDNFYLKSSNVCYFPNNLNDIKFYHNLIWKNGLIGNMTVSADIAFNDENVTLSDGTVLNKFMYLDFTCDVDYIRLFSPNMPDDYVKALAVICDNALRIWDEPMDITNMPNYVLDFPKASQDAQNNAN